MIVSVSLHFDLHVEFDDPSTPALQGNCQFWSESDDYVVAATWTDLCDAIIQPH